ncbi:MAG: hypothetical protein UT55_C0033G0003 [Candidatus Peregrinibacteria bacterium GW2011_GWE2_39_6]|nr:MAG: hypothetical protein UT55_C0033G0003 [Candidatus Peregrinibacteria bacterium GW2011_GWE2_39_6]
MNLSPKMPDHGKDNLPTNQRREIDDILRRLPDWRESTEMIAARVKDLLNQDTNPLDIRADELASSQASSIVRIAHTKALQYQEGERHELLELIEHVFLPEATIVEALSLANPEKFVSINYLKTAGAIFDALKEAKRLKRGQILSQSEALEIIQGEVNKVCSRKEGGGWYCQDGDYHRPYINPTFKNRPKELQELFEKLSIYDFPPYLRVWAQRIIYDQPADLKEFWQIDSYKFRLLAEDANKFIEHSLKFPFPNKVKQCSTAKQLEEFMQKAELRTSEDFEILRGAVLKANVMYALMNVKKGYNEKEIAKNSRKLNQHLARYYTRDESGCTFHINSGSKKGKNPLIVQDVKVHEGKSKESVAIKTMAKDVPSPDFLRDTVRLAVTLKEEDCLTVDQFLAKVQEVLAFMMPAIGTNTVHSDKEQKPDISNLIPLEKGDSQLSVEKFLEKHSQNGGNGSGGKHGMTSSFHRALTLRLTWQVNPKDAQTVELQIRMPTPDDHEQYEQRRRDNIAEKFGFKRKKNGNFEDVNYLDVVKDLIQGLSYGGSLGEFNEEGTGGYNNRPVDEIALVNLIEILSAKKLDEKGKSALVNQDIFENIKKDPKTKGQLIVLLKNLSTKKTGQRREKDRYQLSRFPRVTERRVDLIKNKK